MSFWSKAGELAVKAGGAALNEVKEAGDRAKQYKAEMPEKDNDELLKIVKRDRSSSPLKAQAAFKELKDRGYDAEDINILTK
ncbi:MAG: hypothetical protein KAT04_08640 [Methylococcales bacterium]|nr:hypothetical protein [Methylococcales bacterium]